MEVLDSFNPIFHGVVEYLSTCLTTKFGKEFETFFIDTKISLGTDILILWGKHFTSRPTVFSFFVMVG